MPRTHHTAIRTCVACRRRSAASDLLRVTLDADARLQLDPSGKAPGRGAWVCVQHGCLARLGDKPGMAGRSLRQRPRGAWPLVDAARELVEARAIAALQSSHRAGLVRSGAAQRAAVSDDRIVAILLPHGADPSVEGPGPPMLPTPWSTHGLGAALGRGPRAQLVLLRGSPNRLLLRMLRLRSALG